MNKKLKDRVLKAVWKKDDKYKYIIAISASKAEDNPVDKKYNLKSNISFVLLDEQLNTYVEWIPNFGPISIIEKSTNKNDEYRKECYIFDYSKGRGNWSQLTCDNANLNDAFIDGNYDYIFNIMVGFIE